jgi:hypothetical protein
MTKSSLLSMNIAYFVPKNIIENYNEFAKSYWSNFKLIKNSFIDYYDIKSFYRYKKEKFNLLPYDFWFANETTEESYKNSIIDYTVTWTNDNTNLKETYFFGKTIGGNGILRIPFDSNLLTYNEKIAENIDTYLLYCLSNKYLEYENQRNTD